VVIDPGVGTDRKIVWARIGSQEFLAPDNGLLTHAMAMAELAEARVLPVPAASSATFHGRDVVAAVAARLLDGEPAATIGEACPTLVQLPEATVREAADGIHGEVRFIDHFGNLLTNIPANQWPAVEAAGGLHLSDRWIDRPVRTYGDAPAGSAVALVGSQGVIEVAVVEGSAARLLGGELGTPVRIPKASP
jgi:S-adenosylmethionine hydrolase